jgi:hypothetical protein
MAKEQVEHEETESSSPRLDSADMPKTPILPQTANDNNIDLVSLDSKTSQSFQRTTNPFQKLVNGHGHEINISDESRASAQFFFQQGIATDFQASPAKTICLLRT